MVNITMSELGPRVWTYQAPPAQQKPEVIFAHFDCQCYPFDCPFANGLFTSL
jgi:hypothetical protein